MNKAAPTKPLLADQALEKLISEFEFESVLDIGCGPGLHSQRFRDAGKRVTGIDYRPQIPGVIAADYLEHEFELKFDCIWASHVLEHQPNVNRFLQKIFADLRDGGILAITVPPFKNEVVGGHLTLWNAGVLIYNLIIAGFDCREARCKRYQYNISLITPKIPAALPRDRLRFANGDIELLKQFFPRCLDDPWRQAFNGDIAELNWEQEGLVFRPRKKSIWSRLGIRRAA